MMRGGLWCGGVMVMMVMTSTASSRAPVEMDLFGKAPVPPYVAPNKLFSLQIPRGWKAVILKDRKNAYEFRADNPQITAFFQVVHTPVKAAASPQQMLLVAKERRLKKLAHFEVVEEGSRSLNGLSAAVITGRYWYQGNAQFPRAIEEVFIVAGQDAFTLHFECFADIAPQISAEVDSMYNSFIPRPDLRPKVAPEEGINLLDTIPF